MKIQRSKYEAKVKMTEAIDKVGQTDWTDSTAHIKRSHDQWMRLATALKESATLGVIPDGCTRKCKG